MTAETFKYDFFISYRHGDPDTDTAHYLQKALERYRIPKDIQKKYKKEKIRRVFRDNEELSASFDLAGEIREQLKNSEYLIVICSPPRKRVDLGAERDQHLHRTERPEVYPSGPH